ncbi:MAG: hypothetical protein M3R37_07000 [Actinomycetota bacterium]|nr:hypothetical protein [Actinomycetota bacterium]
MRRHSPVGAPQALAEEELGARGLEYRAGERFVGLDSARERRLQPA